MFQQKLHIQIPKGHCKLTTFFLENGNIYMNKKHKKPAEKRNMLHHALLRQTAAGFDKGGEK